MRPANCLVCEHTGKWARALEQAAGERSLPLIETRSLAELQEELAAAPDSLAVVELSADWCPRVLELLGRCPRRFPASRVLIVAERSLAGYRDLALELGAVWFTTSPRQMDVAVDIARRHLAGKPPGRLSPREEILARLPWPEYAASQHN